MNKQVQKKRVAALRGGEYKQCVGRLCIINEKGEESYCCLGVLSELYNQDIGGLQIEESVECSQSSSIKNKGYGGKYGIPPSCVIDWAGLTDRQVCIVVSGNDGLKSFEQIANAVEEME